MIKRVGNGYRITCDYCGRAVTTIFYSLDEPIMRGGSSCPECLQAVPDEIANSYIQAMEEAGKQNRDARYEQEKIDRLIVEVKED